MSNEELAISLLTKASETNSESIGKINETIKNMLIVIQKLERKIQSLEARHWTSRC